MKLKNSTHVQDKQLKQLSLLSVITLNIAAPAVCMKLKIWSLKIPLASRTEGLSRRIWRGCGSCPPFPYRHSSPHITTSTCGWGVVSFPGRGLARRCWCCLSVTYTGGRVPRCVFNGCAFCHTSQSDYQYTEAQIGTYIYVLCVCALANPRAVHTAVSLYLYMYKV